MKPESFTVVRFLSNLVANPAHDRLAFVLSTTNLEKNRYDSDLVVSDGQTQRIMTHSGKETQVGWMDDTTLIFSSQRDEEKDLTSTEIYRLSIAGGEAELWVKVPLKLTNYRVLKDGSLLGLAAFHLDHPNYHQYSKVKREALHKQWQDEAFVLDIEELPFYVNGDTFTEKRRIRLVHIDVKSLTITPLTPADMMVQQFELNEAQTDVWVLGYRFKGIHPRTNALYHTPLIQPKLKRISQVRVQIGGFEWFQGKIVAYINDRKTYGMNQNSVVAKLTETGQFETVYDPFYSLGNSINSDMRLYGSKSMGVFIDQLVLNTTVEDHSQLVFLNTNFEVTQRVDVPGSCDGLAPLNHSWVMIAMIHQNLQELTTLKGQALSSFNQEAQKQLPMLKPRRLSSFVDQRSMKGWVLLPPQFDAQQSYPGILVIHGGPKTVYGEVYTHEHQLWANQGYVVMYGNPIGGDGRGNAFADIRGRYGTHDYEDLMGFVDTVLSTYPNVDQNRLGVIGGSYGGYMTNWITSHTTRFKAAITQRSISNWTSFYGVSDIGYFFVQDQVQADLHTPMGFEKLWDNSPLKHVRHVKTPTLVIHSKLDYRCPIDQGYQWYASLKRLGVPTKLVLFHEENHDLTRSGKPKARLKSYEEIQAWFNRYLK